MVDYLINRKNFPFFVSVISEDAVMKPLSSMLSNKVFSSTNNCIDYVRDIQNNFRKLLNDGISLGKKTMSEIVLDYKQKLLKLEMCVTELADPRFSQGGVSPINKLRSMLVERLIKEKNNLHNIETMTMMKILDDTRLKGIFERLVDSETKALEESKIKFETDPKKN